MRLSPTGNRCTKCVTGGDTGSRRQVVFDNEGHGFTKKANEIRAYKAILDFLDKHLNGSGTTAAPGASS